MTQEEKKEWNDVEDTVAEPRKRTGAIIMGTLIIAFMAATTYLFLFYLVPVIVDFILGLGGIEINKFLLLYQRIGIILSPIIAFLIAWTRLAPDRRFFAFAEEGTAILITKGGQLVDAAIRWQGHYLDKNGYVRKLAEGQKEPWYPFGGFIYFGLYPFKKIYIYKFKWTGVNYEGQVDKHEEEPMHYIPLMADMYYKKISKVEDINGLPLDAEFLVRMRIVNPGKSRFGINNWLETSLNTTGSVGVRVMKKLSYKNWLSGQATEQAEKGNPLKTLKDLKNIPPPELGIPIMEQLKQEETYYTVLYDYGILIEDIKTLDFGPIAELRDLTLKQYIAEQNKIETMINADAEAYKRSKEAEGEAKAAEQKYEVYGKTPDRLKLRMMEVIEKLAQGGTKWVLSMPQITQMLSETFNKPAEQINLQELMKNPQVAQIFSEILKKPAEHISLQEVIGILPLFIEELRNKTKETNKKSDQKSGEGQTDDDDDDEEE